MCDLDISIAAKHSTLGGTNKHTLPNRLMPNNRSKRSGLQLVCSLLVLHTHSLAVPGTLHARKRPYKLSICSRRTLMATGSPVSLSFPRLTTANPAKQARVSAFRFTLCIWLAVLLYHVTSDTNGFSDFVSLQEVLDSR